MSALAVSATEVALAARCPRQLVLAREGLRVQAGDGAGIGQAAHAILDGFVRRATSDAAGLVSLLEEPSLNEASLASAVGRAFHAELFDQAAAVAPNVRSEALVDLGKATVGLARAMATLLVRAHQAGLRGLEAVQKTVIETERPVTLSSADESVEVSGRLDLLCRDHLTKSLYVWDLKTAVTDEAAAEQVRLYALALRRKGEQARPVLATVERGEVRLTPLGVDEDQEASIEARLRSIRSWLTDGAVPPAASAVDTCKACIVQSRCWSRWGRTLSGAAEEEPVEGIAGADDDFGAEVRRLASLLRTRRIPLARFEASDACAGPSVVRLRLELKDGADMRRIERAGRDIQREMGWSAEPMISNDGKFLAIDAPRRKREVVEFGSADFLTDQELVVPLGLGLSGEALTLDLGDAPHLLVAGTTGSGKTNFLQSMLLSLAAKQHVPLLYVVDPKAVDFVSFDALPLAEPVLTDAAEAVALLRRLVDEEMPRRTEILGRAGARNRSELPPEVVLPAIVVIIDELADLLAVLTDRATKADFLSSLQRLLARSRAVGIHLVIATQRPSVKIIDGDLKGNLPTRVAFRLPTAADSTTILGEAGAERLLGKGDLLLRTSAGALQRAQAYAVLPQHLPTRRNS